jgi:Family of unknown function (DUF5906)
MSHFGREFPTDDNGSAKRQRVGEDGAAYETVRRGDGVVALKTALMQGMPSNAVFVAPVLKHNPQLPALEDLPEFQERTADDLVLGGVKTPFVLVHTYGNHELLHDFLSRLSQPDVCEPGWCEISEPHRIQLPRVDVDISEIRDGKHVSVLLGLELPVFNEDLCRIVVDGLIKLVLEPCLQETLVSRGSDQVKLHVVPFHSCGQVEDKGFKISLHIHVRNHELVFVNGWHVKHWMRQVFTVKAKDISALAHTPDQAELPWEQCNQFLRAVALATLPDRAGDVVDMSIYPCDKPFNFRLPFQRKPGDTRTLLPVETFEYLEEPRVEHGLSQLLVLEEQAVREQVWWSNICEEAKRWTGETHRVPSATSIGISNQRSDPPTALIGQAVQVVEYLAQRNGIALPPVQEWLAPRATRDTVVVSLGQKGQVPCPVHESRVHKNAVPAVILSMQQGRISGTIHCFKGNENLPLGQAILGDRGDISDGSGEVLDELEFSPYLAGDPSLDVDDGDGDEWMGDLRVDELSAPLTTPYDISMLLDTSNPGLWAKTDLSRRFDLSDDIQQIWDLQRVMATLDLYCTEPGHFDPVLQAIACKFWMERANPTDHRVGRILQWQRVKRRVDHDKWIFAMRAVPVKTNVFEEDMKRISKMFHVEIPNGTGGHTVKQVVMSGRNTFKHATRTLPRLTQEFFNPDPKMEWRALLRNTSQLNCFTGFPLSELSLSPDEREVSLKLIDMHIRGNVCGGDPRAYGHVLAWIGMTLLAPEVQFPHLLWLYGPQGAGKNILIDRVAAMAGIYGVSISRPEDIIGQFNDAIRDKIVVVLGDPDTLPLTRLKELVTGVNMAITTKYAPTDAYEPNYVHFALMTNPDRPIELPRQSRRELVVEGRFMQHTPKYFSAVHQAMKAFPFYLHQVIENSESYRAAKEGQWRPLPTKGQRSKVILLNGEVSTRTPSEKG